MNYIYKTIGKTIPRTAIEQYKKLTPVPQSTPFQPGDLLFWDTGLNHRTDNRLPDGSYVSHVSLYAGNGKMRHASSKKGVITVDVQTYAGKFKLLGARRVIGNQKK